MAQKHAAENGFEYDIIIRSRPDNSMYPKMIDLSQFEIKENIVYSTRFYTGHRDPWFFAFATPKTFNKYCSFIYLPDADNSRLDNNFDCPELAMEKYLPSIGIQLAYYTDICLTFTGFHKDKPIFDFPYRDRKVKLIDAQGNFVKQVE